MKFSPGVCFSNRLYLWMKKRAKSRIPFPKSGKFWGGESFNVSVDYKLRIPEKAALKANNISGDIQLKKS